MWDKIRTPEPHREGCVARLHDCPSRKGSVLLAVTATQYDGSTGSETVGLPLPPTSRALEAVGPAHHFKVLGAGVVGREHTLKLREIRGKAARAHSDNLTSAKLFVKKPDKHGSNQKTNCRVQKI
jgi:hypothetical protein